MSAIRTIETTLVRIPSGSPYQMGAMERGASHAISIIVRVETEDGIDGWGECFLTPGWYGADTPAGMLWLIDSVFGPRLKGVSVFDIEKIERGMQKMWQLGNWYPKSAIEIAVRDAAARTIGQPLHAMMGGAFRDRFPMSGGIGTEAPEVMAAKAMKFKERGFKTVKLKIDSVHDLETDVARVREVREAIGPDIKIRLDGNGVYNVPLAVRLSRAIEKYNIESLEQPVQAHDLKGMAEIRQQIGIPLMADESVHTMHDALAVIEHRAADIIKLKVSKCGGLGPSRRIADLCQAAGIEVTVGNGFNTSLLATAELQLACSCSAILPAGEFIGPDKLEDDICIPMRIEDGDAILPKGPGLGIEIDRAKLEKYATTLEKATAALA
ncbi:COG4948 L-alanine-DL-glutamate epimerase and related enzymes of enolase superfamily [Caulobacteraceae bacterium]